MEITQKEYDNLLIAADRIVKDVREFTLALTAIRLKETKPVEPEISKIATDYKGELDNMMKRYHVSNRDLADYFKKSIQSVAGEQRKMNEANFRKHRDAVMDIANNNKEREAHDFSSMIRQYLNENGVTQTQLAGYIGCSISHMSRLISGANKSFYEKIVGICKEHKEEAARMDCAEWNPSKHTNLENFEFLMKTEMNEVKNVALLESIKEWMRYKDGRGKTSKNHYQLVSIRKLTNRAFKDASKYGTQKMIDVIDRSIASNYQGLVWVWIEK